VKPEPSTDPASVCFVADDEYARLRRCLIMFFERRGCLTADILADDCFARLAASMKSGWKPANLRNYMFGIAGNVYLEYMRSPERSWEEVPANMSGDSNAPAAEDSRLIANVVVGRLSPEERELLESHYLDKVSWKKLAGGTGLTQEGLRVRVMRLRNRLLEDFGDQLNSIGLKRKTTAPSVSIDGL
jgi:DNA-directed RNA polymerase specialized sigma24 family protein